MSIFLASSITFTWVVPKSTFLLLVISWISLLTSFPSVISRSTSFPYLKLVSAERRAWDRNLCIMLGFFGGAEQIGCATTEMGKFKICRRGHQAGDPGSTDVAFWIWRPSASRIPLAWERAVFSFILYHPSTDCMRPTYIMEGNMLYLESTDLKFFIFL